MKTLIAFSLTLLALANIGDGAKILIVFPFPGKSHSLLGEGHVRLLSEAGHQVTFVTPFKPSQNFKNTRIIDTSSVVDTFMEDMITMTNITKIMDGESGINTIGTLFDVAAKVSRLTLSHENFQKVMNDPSEQFDVIIIEWMFGHVYSGLQAVFKCPYIWSSSAECHSAVLKLIDEPLNPAYTTDVLSLETPPFSFFGRVAGLFQLVSFDVVGSILLAPAEEKIYNEILVPIIKKRGHEVPELTTLIYNASLMLGNSHVSLGQSTRLPQSYKAIAGYHINVKDQHLTPELQKILDTAEHGVIYFSMGSNLKSKDMPTKLKQDLLELFGKLKYTVLWKLEEDFPNLPKNVHILQWAPQQAILAHPNCKLFITHGGLLSTTEAVHFGVPIIGIPVFADQFTNAKRAERRGFAIEVKLSHTMANELEVAIKTILSNPKYAEKVKELSLIYHDRPVSPGKEVVHWVEHVVKTKGAPHLRSLALSVPWYQKIYLDLAFVVLAVITLIVNLLKRLCRVVCSKKKVDISKKMN